MKHCTCALGHCQYCFLDYLTETLPPGELIGHLTMALGAEQTMGPMEEEHASLKLLHNEDCNIFFSKDNPHRQNTNKHAVYEAARGATTVKKAKETGASLWDLKELMNK